jgi:hypothetical protein
MNELLGLVFFVKDLLFLSSVELPDKQKYGACVRLERIHV